MGFIIDLNKKFTINLSKDFKFIVYNMLEYNISWYFAYK